MTTSLLRGVAAAVLALLVAVAPAAVATAVPVGAASVSSSVASGVVAPAAPVGAPAAAPVVAVPAGVDDFTFASFDAVYELGRDRDGRSVLDTTETIVAQFPEFDQNRGIRRAIPLDYDGHPIDVQVVSVTDAEGQPRAYDTEEDDDGEFLLVTIAGSEYVHGEQTYVISYRQRNVTHQPDDAAIDEFYWDVNGTGWAQPFGVVRAELRVDEALTEAFAGDAACYRGGAGADTPCETLEYGGEPLLVAEAVGVGPYENLTIAVAFEPGTFVPRDEAFASSPAAITSAVCAFIALALFVLALVLRLTRWRSAPRGTVIAQYEPPHGISALTAADLVGQPSRGVTATILERAVAGEVRIVDRDRGQYSVQFMGGPLGDLDAQSVVRALFSDHPALGQERSLSSKSTALGQRLLAIRKAVAKRVVESGLRRSPAVGGRILIAVFAFAAAVLGFIAAVVALEQVMGGPWPLIALIAGVVFALAAGATVAGVRPLTVEGRRVHDHLEGLRLFIRLAEADRIRMLQSPSGALRDPLTTAPTTTAPVTSAPPSTDAAASLTATDPAEVLRLTERLLPYAALFGLEKQWLRELADLYEVNGREPGWYAGTSAFDAARFSVAVASFTTTSTTSWSGSSSSSSSSGSGGGGSSGGGGGGGGGGGV